MLRAQALAASIAASLEVMSRFVATSLQPAAVVPQHTVVTPKTPVQQVHHEQVAPAPEPVETEIELHSPVLEVAEAEPPGASSEQELEGDFNVSRLSTEEQELHRRANRVAKVSMQDIKMLHPEKVRQGRENKDLCVRLKDDIEKAHREYDRRFKPIMDHPVDYFYRWMVEILADGDPHALGEYPYAMPARQR